MIRKSNIEIIPPRHQLNLFGYKNYFNFFVRLFNQRKLPNVMLFNGLRGIGKSTFSYHFINYLLSLNEKDQYNKNELTINPDNKSYKFICNKTHPNFFSLENNLTDEDIKIDQVRSLIKFLNKSTYLHNLKIVMIDNAENLNISSSNALLKALEEPANNTFFFIIHHSSSKIPDTIKSRCIEFNFFFNTSQKKEIFENIIRTYKINFSFNDIDENIYYDTPGNLCKYLSIFNKSINDILQNKLSCVLHLVEEYKNSKDSELLTFASSFIEKFYNEQCLINTNKLSHLLYNKIKILSMIDDMKKFNLDKKNFLISLNEILKNEA